MFRPLRRKKRAITDEEARELLKLMGAPFVTKA